MDDLDDQIADDLIQGRLKASKSYHSSYGKLTYGKIKQLARAKPPDMKARQMKKLIEQTDRLSDKSRSRPT